MFKQLVAATGLSMVALAAQASALSYDANLANGVFFGSGNANGGFTVFNGNGLELGLRAKVRYNDADLPENTFNSNHDGSYTHAVGAPAAYPARARWNFEFSIDSANGLGDYSYRLGVDADASANADYFIFDPLLIGDNALTATQAQNSHNLGFYAAAFAGAGLPAFNPNSTGTYSFYLAAFQNDVEVGRTAIDVNVVDNRIPEPSSLALLGVALLGLGAARRRR